MHTPSPLYDDLAILVEKVISIAIKSHKKLSLIHFYDAYRGLHKLNKALCTVLSNDFDISFDSPHLQNSSFGAPEDKWRFFLNKYLDKATLECRTFLLLLGEIHYKQDGFGVLDLPIERLVRHKIYYSLARDYDCGVIEKGTCILRTKVMEMPNTKRVITDYNCLSLTAHEENIEELNIRKRLAEEGRSSLERLRKIELRMERYLMKHARLNDLMVGEQK